MKQKKLTPGQLTPAQLGKLAEQLPGASSLLARRIEEKIVQGFFSVDKNYPVVKLANAAPAGFPPVLDTMKLSVRELSELVHGSKEAALKWMHTPCPMLGGRIPSGMTRLREGREHVREVLIGIGSGNFQ